MLRMIRSGAATLVILLLTAAVVAAQSTPLVISGETTVIVRKLPFTVTAPADGQIYVWTHPSTVKSTKKKNVLTVTSAPSGEVTINVAIGYKDKDQDDLSITFVVGAVPPLPPPGPGPDPGPRPPEPVPPDPAPIPVAGFRALIVFETAEATKLPAAQQSILYGKAVRDALNTACVDDPQTGSKKAWWILDKDSDVSALAKHWQDAMKRPRKSVPWLILSNGKTGYEGPLPKDSAEMIALINKYALSASKKGGK